MNVLEMTHQKGGKSAFDVGLLPGTSGGRAVFTQKEQRHWSSPCVQLSLWRPPCSSSQATASPRPPTRLGLRRQAVSCWAHRCGIETERVEHAGAVIHDMIVSASYDPTEEAAADSRFARIFMASAFPGQDGDALIPACKVVIVQFERLERHHQ
jgi:hypothetical protein